MCRNNVWIRNEFPVISPYDTTFAKTAPKTYHYLISGRHNTIKRRIKTGLN